MATEKELNKGEFRVLISQRIKKLRISKNISQAELARRASKDRQHIELIENNKILPSLYTLYQLSIALEIKFIEIVDIESDLLE